MSDSLNNSYYAATANAWETQPDLLGSLKCDVIVVGGGFTGLSAALACAENGLSVALFEAETIGFGASGRNGGQLIPGLRWSMQEIDAQFGRERAKAIFDLAWSAAGRVNSRVVQHNISCDLKSGHLEAAYRPAHFEEMQREAAFLSANFGWDSIEIVRPSDMGKHINGGNYHGGLYDHQGGHFHPLNYALGLAAAAKKAGVQIFENSRVAGYFEHGKGDVEVFAGTTDNAGNSGAWAKHLIIATDAWIGQIAPALAAYTVPIMNYNIATEPLANADQLMPSDAAIADSRFVLNYFRLSADKRMIFGGGEKYVQTPPKDIGKFVRKHMAEVFPSLAETKIDYAWGGVVAVTSNRLPHMGRNGSVFFAHGFSGHGALITTLAGELIAEALIGTMGRFDVFAKLPHTRFPGGKLLARPLATLGLLWYALRDRLG